MCALKLPFDAVSIPALSLKIMRGIYDKIPYFYSKELKMLVDCLLAVNPDDRPNINEILSNFIVR